LVAAPTRALFQSSGVVVPVGWAVVVVISRSEIRNTRYE
jgi:hypothetical protein